MTRPTSGAATTRWACARDAESGDPSSAVRALDALLPAPVDHFLVQADLTVVVPGPPEPALAAELEVVAEHESAGGASVHRVTAASVRRALDAGYAADDLHDAVPPPVAYPGAAGADLPGRRRGPQARRAAGRLRRRRTCAATTRRCSPRCWPTGGWTPLALRRLAPTVLVTPYQVGRLLSALRDAGYAPVPEDAHRRGGAGPARRSGGPRPGCR